MLVVSRRSNDQQSEHEYGIGVAHGGRLPRGDHSQQQVQEGGSHKLGHVVDQLEGQGC